MTRRNRQLALHLGTILLLCALLYLPGLGRVAADREQELRVLLTARAMAEGGSLIVPEYRGEVRLRKPPVMYWLVAAAYRLAGDTTSLTAARAVSATAATLLALAVYLGGRRWVGPRRALAGALILASSLIVLRQGRLAETDMPLTLCATLACMLVAAALQRQDRRAGWFWAGAGLCAGAGFMVKGPAALGIPLATAVVLAVWPARKPRGLSAWRGSWIALAVFGLLVAPWYAAIWHYTQAAAADQLGKELSATFAESRHAGPPVYYVYTGLHAMAPWGLLLPFALAASLRTPQRRTRLRIPLAWFGAAFLLLSAISSKQIHYATLLMPPAALLTGWYAGRRTRWTTIYLCIAGALFLAAGPVLAVLTASAPPRPAGVMAAAIGTSMAGLLAIVFRRRFALAVAALTAALAGAVAIYATHLESRYEAQTMIEECLVAHRAQFAAAPRVLAVGGDSAMCEFYLGRRPASAASLADAWRIAAAGDMIIAVADGGQTLRPESVPQKPIFAAARGGTEIMLFQIPRLETPP